MLTMSENSVRSNSEFAVYRALYDYTPDQEDEAAECIVMCRNDLLQVRRPLKLDSGTEHKPGGWLFGRNLRTNEEGLFPCEAYVEYVPSAEKPSPLRRPKPFGGHKLAVVYFVKPQLCACCNDFISGVKVVGRKCEVCGIVVHTSCELYIVSTVGQCSLSHSSAVCHQTFTSEVPVAQWDVDNVAEWMATVNLLPLVHVFRRHKVDGNALSLLDASKLQEMQVSDKFHQEAVLTAINSLLCHDEIQANGDQSSVSLCIPNKTSGRADHQLIEYSFSSVQHCHICGRPLLGIERQGYQCRQCGLCCHRQCIIRKLPACDINVTEGFRRLSFSADSVYGAPLAGDSQPAFVVKCIDILENVANSGVNIPERYCQSCSADELSRLKKLIKSSEDVETVCSSTQPVFVAGLLKTFLIELPDSVIPEKHYQSFIEAANCSDDQENTLNRLVSALPSEHQTVLRHLIIHLRHVCRTSSWGESSAVEKVGDVFGGILLRPSRADILENLSNLESRHHVVTALMQSNMWCELEGAGGEPSTPVLPPPRPPKIKSRMNTVDPTKTKPAMHYGRIEDAPWYWGSISKEAVNELMNDTADGSFLVRDATAASAKGQYTLTVRKGGSNKLIRIMYQDGRYGFSNPLQFASVPELVNYYSKNSLSEYNSSLDTVLIYPIIKTEFSNEPVVDINELRRNYVKKQKEYLKLSDDFDEVTDLHLRIMQELVLQNQALEAFNGTLEMFHEQLKLCEANQGKVAPQDSIKLRENMDTLKLRLRQFNEKREELKRNIERQTELSRKHVARTNEMKPELKRLNREREQLKKQLLSHGESISSLDQLIDNTQGQVVEDKQSPIPFLNERLWFIHCDRREAERLLAGTEEGTFLIRPRDEPNSFALSIVKPPDSFAGTGQVVHCIIDWKETGYGFSHPYYIHQTLRDLVMHYREQTLFDHNDALDTTLKKPIGLVNMSSIEPHMSFSMQQTDPSQLYVPVTPRHS